MPERPTETVAGLIRMAQDFLEFDLAGPAVRARCDPSQQECCQPIVVTLYSIPSEASRQQGDET
jgi:hypothetical protein